MKRKLASVLFVVGAALGWAQVPPNDYFTNRITLVGPVATFGGDLSQATWPEVDTEPCPEGYCGHSLWWSWTAQDATPVAVERIDGFNAELAAMAVYTGTNIATLGYNEICHIDLQRRGQYAVFQPQVGQEYQILAAGIQGKPISYRWTVTTTPIFRLQPKHQTVSVGQSALFTAYAIGVKPLHFQWQRQGVDLDGATNQMLAIENCASSNSADYSLVVTSATGVNTSAVARLVVATNGVQPLLANLRIVRGSDWEFTATGEEGRKYQIEYSTDLLSWSSPWLGVLVNTNPTTTFQVAKDSQMKFLRLKHYHPVDERCNNNMRQLRFAAWAYAEDNHKDDLTAVWAELLSAYLIEGRIPKCPTTGSGYSMTDLFAAPTCEWGSRCWTYF